MILKAVSEPFTKLSALKDMTLFFDSSINSNNITDLKQLLLENDIQILSSIDNVSVLICDIRGSAEYNLVCFLINYQGG